MDKGILVVISGFSGAGKGTVIKKLLSESDDYWLSVSMTTRAPRPGEEDGKDYFFVTHEKFEQTIAENGYRFPQQFDPFTGQASLVHAVTHQPVREDSGEPIQDAYGPTMLAALEYIAHRYGIHPHLGEVWFSLGSGEPCEYDASFCGRRYAIRNNGSSAEIRADGKTLGRFPCGQRIVTDARGRLLRRVPIE